MLTVASLWQSAHDLPAMPAFSFQSVSPDCTNSIAGLAVSSSCIFCSAGPMSW